MRRMGRFYLRTLYIVAFAAVLFAPVRAWACSCIEEGPACQAFFRTHAVFVGRVLGVTDFTAATDISGRTFTFARRHVRLTVSESFSGVQSNEVTVDTGAGGGDCGYPFVVGESYLVYAYAASDGTLGAGICSRTRPVHDASTDLVYLRGLKDIAPALGQISGHVMLSAENPTNLRERTPLPNGRVVAEGVGTQLSALTQADGSYTIAGPPGQYHLRLELPENLYARPSFDDRDLRIPDNRGCAQADFIAYHDGHVSGQVLDAEKRPVPYASLELREPLSGNPTLSPRSRARTDINGRFEFTHVGPGRYLLGINTLTEFQSGTGHSPLIVYPGTRDVTNATTIYVPAGERVPLNTPFVVPPDTRFVTLTGTVLDVDGKPVWDVHVYLKPNDRSVSLIGEAVLTDRDGRFAIAAVEGGDYLLEAEEFGPAIALRRAGSAPVLASRNSAPIVLRFSTPRR
jgi:hypothetical protein